MRGQIYNIEDKSFFAFGGAGSHDISAGILDPDASDYKKKKKMLDKNPFALYRINHVSWWERELPNEEEMKEGLVNLQKQNNKIVALNHNILWLEGKNWRKINQFLSYFFVRFYRYIGLKNGFREIFRKMAVRKERHGERDLYRSMN